MSRPSEPNPTDVLRTLARLGATGKCAVYLRPSAGEEAIAAMQAAAERDLGGAVPDGYVAFLRITNGLQINGTYLKAAETLVPENLDTPHPSIIVLGNRGNYADCVYCRGDRRFHIVNMGQPGERLASFDRFEEMLLAVMEDEQVL